MFEQIVLYFFVHLFYYPPTVSTILISQFLISFSFRFIQTLLEPTFSESYKWFH